MGVNVASEDDGGIGEIEGGGCDVEDSDDSEGRANANEVESDGEEDDEPDGIYGCLSIGVDFRPESSDRSA